MKNHVLCGMAVLGFATLLIARAGAHELLVGRNAENQIAMHFDDEAFELPVSEFEGFPGFAAADPGFVATAVDRPGEGLFMLPDTVDLAWTLLAISPELQLLNDNGSGPLGIGESYSLGAPLFHVHPLWHSPTGTPGAEYSLTLRIHDRNEALSDSGEYTLRFTPTPEPASAVLMLLGAAALLRRR